MKLTDQEIAKLSADLDRKHVKSRQSYSYIEGWHAISEANRIFGFDGWDRETVDIKCVHEGPRKMKSGDGYSVSYTAKVRISVKGITREGCGAGHGMDRDAGQAHESAIKEAETDAMKRAFMTFGNPFGLALYDKKQVNVGDPDKDAKNAMIHLVGKVDATNDVAGTNMEAFALAHSDAWNVVRPDQQQWLRKRMLERAAILSQAPKNGPANGQTNGQGNADQLDEMQY